MLIIGGIYFELQSPGMGFPSVVAIMAAVLYFLPLYLTGVAASWLVILFVVGLLLELFVIPGFGVCGIAGMVCIGASLFIGLLDNFSVEPGAVDTHVVFQASVTFVLAVAAAVGLVFYLTSRYAPMGIRRVTELTHSQDIDKGYIGVDTSLARLVGSDATAETDLRPGGKVQIDGETYDAVSTHGFIEAGTTLKVVRFENAQLYVKPRG